MEFVQGSTLRDLLTERRRLNPVEACAILEQMLSAIAAAHRAGLVHRDVKPENVLVAAAPSGGAANLVDAVVKVADFGLARAVEASGVDDSGQLMATVAYVAPELVTDGHADARTDVYSAGIVLYEMLTGKVPFDGDDPVAVAWEHVDNDVPPPSQTVKGVPKALDDIVARATRRDPGARPTDAGAMLAEVQSVRDDLGAQNVQTALLRQVPPSRHSAADATAMVPAVTDRPSWARLPEQSRNTQTYRRGDPDLRPAGGIDRRRIFLGAAIAVMVLVVIGSTWWVTLGRYTDAPTLVNMTKEQAQLYARQHNFELITANGQYSETIPKDTVVSQKPGPQERIVSGGTITITLSLGQERFEVPDLAGVEVASAKTQLAQLNLQYKEGAGQYSDTVPEGSVISTTPDKGTELKKGDTVTVVVSKGRAPIQVPNLVGMNVNDARNQLQGLGLTAVERYKDSNQPQDQVVAQTPKAGSGVANDAEITLDVSKGPPQVTVPDVSNQQCQQAQQTLQGLGLQVQVVGFNQNGFVRGQNPGGNTPVQPGSQVVIQCF
jgi:serine/threonine-protein kinase